MPSVDDSETSLEQHFVAAYPNTPLPVYRACKDAARSQKTITYSELATICDLGLDYSSPGDRTKISNMLGDVAEFEFMHGRPMLSAVVVLKNSSPITPGEGFFDWADKLGVPRRGQVDNQKFWAMVLKEVFEYWTKP